MDRFSSRVRAPVKRKCANFRELFGNLKYLRWRERRDRRHARVGSRPTKRFRRDHEMECACDGVLADAARTMTFERATHPDTSEPTRRVVLMMIIGGYQPYQPC